MAPRWTVVIVVLLAVAGVVTPAIATSAIDTRAEQRDPFDPLPSNETVEANATMGSQISAFMESSAVAVSNSVETGIWVHQFNASENRTDMVDRRATVLERRLEALRAELNETGSGNVTDPSDARRLAALQARIDALNSTLQRTQQVASEAGVNTTRLERLRNNASRLHGQDVARMARNLTTVGPPVDRGPPANHGPPGAGPPNQSGNGTHGPPGHDDTHGQPTDPENATQRTPSERPGRTNETNGSDSHAPKSSDDTSDDPPEGQPASPSTADERASERSNE